MLVDLFCRVVDNWGDAGFCWRLAKELSKNTLIQNHFKASPTQIRLFCDDLLVMQKFMKLSPIQELPVALYDWDLAESILKQKTPDVILETFSSSPPTSYLCQFPPDSEVRLINIEYLSSEDWIETHHGLASIPHSSSPVALNRYFYYPGFTRQTGGILVGDLPSKNSAIPNALSTIWPKDAHLSDPKISVFTYGGESLIHFIEGLTKLSHPLTLLICDGLPQKTINDFLSLHGFHHPHLHKNLSLIPVPFLSQEDYDWLLLQCDLNLVRGEDSFVRAQLAGKPFIWDIYPQENAVHLLKRDAFLEKYTALAPSNLQRHIRNAFQGELPALWWDALPLMQKNASMWQESILNTMSDGDLSVQLIRFIDPFAKIG